MNNIINIKLRHSSTPLIIEPQKNSVGIDIVRSYCCTCKKEINVDDFYLFNKCRDFTEFCSIECAKKYPGSCDTCGKQISLESYYTIDNLYWYAFDSRECAESHI